MITQIIPCMMEMYAVYKNKEGGEIRDRIIALGFDPDLDETAMIIPMAFCSGLGVNSSRADCCQEFLRYELGDRPEEKESDALPVEFLLGQEPEDYHFKAAHTAYSICRSRRMNIIKIDVFRGVINVTLGSGTTVLHFEYDLQGRVRQVGCSGGNVRYDR